MTQNRDLSTSREQVFGDVEPGTECRVCGRPVEDGRRKTCSVYCGNLQVAVMGLLNWVAVRQTIIDRDDQTCQVCGWDRRQELRARNHIAERVEAVAGPEPTAPLQERSEDFDWDAFRERRDAWRDRRTDAILRYGDPLVADRELEVDHIQPLADGGHPFDPANLQTLCSECHLEKTAQENKMRTPTRGELSESLFDYLAAGGDR